MGMIEIRLPFRLKRPVLACGGDIKGAFALAKGRSAFLIDGFGDLADPDNLEAYEKAAAGYGKRLGIKPAVIACDLHPGYFSGRFAEGLARKDNVSRICRVQHHEAHVAAAMAENAIEKDAIGVAFDGTGYGSDGNIWGGEFFAGSPKRFIRAAHFDYVRMPGADAAVREPWRMAASYLYGAFGRIPAVYESRFGRIRLAVIRDMMDSGTNSPLTSSVGRLFDGAGSLILGKDYAESEAQLPMELENMALSDGAGHYNIRIEDRSGVLILDVKDMIKGLVKDISRKVDRRVMSGRFHNAIAGSIAAVSRALRRRYGLNKVVLSGGVFRNMRLSATVSSMLKDGGFKVFANTRVSAGDSGLPLGQIAIAASRSGSCA